MTLPTGTNLRSLGARIRDLRIERQFTLAEVAKETAIASSTLSRLESGQRTPSLDMTVQLARFFGMSVDQLLAEPQAEDPRVRIRPFVRHGVTYIPLSRHNDGLSAFKQIFPPNSGVGALKQRSHDGYDWMYVLSGKLRVLLGDQDLVISAGEAVELDTTVPHAFGSANARPTEVLALFGGQGERVHLSARTR